MTNKRQIIAWSFYDWANSAFSTVVTTFIFAAYFTRHIAVNETVGTTQWAYAMGTAGLIIAVLSPVLGAIADHTGHRKLWLGFFTLMSITATALLWYARPEQSYMMYTLTMVVIATIGFEIGMVFYNAMLPELAPPDYIGRVSGWAWGLGYAGGLSCLILYFILFIQGSPAWLHQETFEQIRIAGPFVAAWFAIFSLPLFIAVKQENHVRLNYRNAVSKGLTALWDTFKEYKKHRNTILFLLAHMFYHDGINTIFVFGGIYAAGSFNMNNAEIIQFAIVLNLSAGIGAVTFAWIDDFLGAKPTLLTSIIGISFCVTGLLLTQSKSSFWIISLIMGLFVGPAQAASRSLLARITTPASRNEMFGLLALSGKITSFIGPWVVGITTMAFASQRIGIASVLFFLITGGLILLSVKVEPEV